MPDARYVLTGATSDLGQALVRALAADASARIVGLVTGRRAPSERPGNASYVEQDLTAPLSNESRHALESADRVVHLAWLRPGSGVSAAEAAAENLRIVERLVAVPRVGERLVFVSSIAASPRAPGHYGRSKHEAQQRVLAAGGSAAVCGLVAGDPPAAAFATLVEAYRRLPVGIKLVPNTLRIYPVCHADAIGVLAALARGELASGAYGAFLAGGVRFNDFAAWLMTRYAKRKPSLPLPAAAGIIGAKLARVLGLDGPAEKLATFFFKDPSALDALLTPPESLLSETQREFGPLAARG